MDRLDEALVEGLEAQRLDPLSAAPTHWVAFCLLCMADYDGAIREFRKALALYPHWVWGWIKLSVTYARKGALSEGLEAVTRAEVESGGKASPLAKRWMAYSYSRCGGLEGAQALNSELMGPREDSSGARIRRGGITKTGNAHLRRIAVEAAWAYRHRPAVGGALRKRQAPVSEEVRAIGWKAQLRLHARYRKLLGRGKCQLTVKIQQFSAHRKATQPPGASMGSMFQGSARRLCGPVDRSSRVERHPHRQR